MEHYPIKVIGTGSGVFLFTVLSKYTRGSGSLCESIILSVDMSLCFMLKMNVL